MLSPLLVAMQWEEVERRLWLESGGQVWVMSVFRWWPAAVMRRGPVGGVGSASPNGNQRRCCHVPPSMTLGSFLFPHNAFWGFCLDEMSLAWNAEFCILYWVLLKWLGRWITEVLVENRVSSWCSNEAEGKRGETFFKFWIQFIDIW